jgi:hypothetical protein
MKRTAFFLIGAVVVAVFITIGWWKLHPEKATPLTTNEQANRTQGLNTKSSDEKSSPAPSLNNSHTPLAVTVQAPAEAPQVPEPISIRMGKKLDSPPVTLKGFWEWTEIQQERAVTSMRPDPSWNPETRNFLLYALKQRFLTPVTRNNIAAGLMRQEPQIPGLDRMFLEMARDPDETPVWRDYALQFLTQTFDRVTDPTEIVTALQVVLTDSHGPEAGTAATHLANLAESGSWQPDEHFDQQLMGLVQDPTRHEASRSSVLAILGQRGYAPALAEARKLAPSAELPGIRRAAVGVVGRRGEASDVALLHALTTDAEPSVRLVATQALKALEKSLKPKSADSPEVVPPQ